MCDYSTHGLPNRLGRVGEELLLKYLATGSKGFVSANPEAKPKPSWWQGIKAWFAAPRAAADCVVCIPPGATLRLHGIEGELRRQTGGETNPLVTFVELNFLKANAYRDAVIFRNGLQLKIQSLPEGLIARVISLGGEKDDTEHITSTATAYEREFAERLAPHRW